MPANRWHRVFETAIGTCNTDAKCLCPLARSPREDHESPICVPSSPQQHAATCSLRKKQGGTISIFGSAP
eukprot:6071894-Amphidinium_carterae.1